MGVAVRGAVSVFFALVALADLTALAVAAGEPTQRQPAASRPVPLAADYVIGPDDVLTITVVGQAPKYSGDVTVRPDGKIAMPLIGEIVTAGLTSSQLRAELTKANAKFVPEAAILVSVKQINSRRVWITGLVAKPGEYRLSDPMDLLQLIARAGGVQGSIESTDIRILRPRPDGSTETIVFDTRELFVRAVTLPQLRPGDQVVVK
jgi:polysaccharide export outer membrane protein